MSEQTRPNIQDAFLNAARKADIPVSIYVTNGYLINGAKILSFDNFSVLVEAGGNQMLIYKHAISTITPQSPVFPKVEEKHEQ
ncbi:MAG: RNA chaperone Hfq [Clostridia bacterium]|nr:RNA chaperone Hfq [Clostridia bacterium]